MKTIEVPKQAFLGLVEGFLNETGYKLYLVVEELAATKEIGCCTEILKIASPDDVYVQVKLENPKQVDCVEREYKCGKQHITRVYWCPVERAVFTTGR